MPIKSVSINKEMEEFLIDNPEISLSTIIQSKLLEIMEFQKRCSGCLQLANIKRANQKALQFIADKGFYEEFNK